jgi:MFS family permease
MTYLALPWFALVTTGSAARMGVVLAVQMAPIALLGIPSGTLVSRLGARRTMLLGDALRAPLMASIPLLHAAGALSFPLLLVLVFALGCFLAPYFSAQRLILPELLGDDERTVSQANAVVEVAARVSLLAGPALAGVLIAAFSAPAVLYIDAATFVVSFVLLKMPVPSRPPAAGGEQARGVLAGLRYLVRHPLLGPLLGTAMLMNFFGTATAVALPVLAYEDFGESSRVAGLFYASFGIGALVGGLAAVKLIARFDPMKLAAAGILWIAAPVWLLTLELPAWAVVLALATSALGGPFVNAPVIGMLTTRPPEELRAKVLTATMAVATAAGPLGMLACGQLLGLTGVHVVLGCIAAGDTLGALLFATVALRAARSGASAPPAAAAAA